MSEDLGTRTLVVRCPDWSVLASDPEPAAPVIVVRANRVVAASMAARAAGIEVGLKRRESQRRCPSVEVVEHDPDRDARAFEPVLATVEDLRPGVAALRPGLLAVRAPDRWYGNETYAAATVALPSLQVSALGVCVAMAVSSGSRGLEAVVLLTDRGEVSPFDLDVLRGAREPALTLFDA